MTNRILGAAALAAVLLCSPACEKQHETKTIEEAPQLASVLKMGDSAIAKQLLSGFYGVEEGAWRWTSRQFSVNLRPPAQSAQQGAVLQVQLSIPPSSIQKLGSMTLTSSIGGAQLGSEAYSKPDQYTYKVDVPASALGSDVVKVDFQLDKALPPGESDKRELGVVVSNIALVAK